MDKGRHGRKDRLIKEKRHDVYRETGKWTDPTVCSKCGALFSNGRWTWETTAQKAQQVLCPACRRITENYPAGYVEIKGKFFKQHQEEILNLARNIESQEKQERPLERIMAISDNNDHTLVTTTGIHIARRIGEALSRSYKGDLSFNYTEGDKEIRVYWQRAW